MPVALSEFVKKPEIATRLKGFYPERPKARPAIRVGVASKQPHHLGTAFDYLFRFDLQRRHPHAEDRGWTADAALRLIRPDDDKRVADPIVFVGSTNTSPPTADQVYAKAGDILSAARRRHAEYLTTKSLTPALLRAVAADALRLAHLDLLVRANKLDADFGAADEGDVDTLLASCTSSRSTA